MAGTMTSIFDATTACRQIFVAATKTPQLMKEEWAENLMADFNLWAASAGASTTGKASLDYRLRTNPQALRIITNLLLILKALVEDCIDDTDLHNGVLSRIQLDRMKDIEGNLNQLVRLTVAIRKAGTQSRLQKADSSFNPSRPQILALRLHLMAIILVHPGEDGSSNSSIRMLEEAHLDEVGLNPIQLRLIDANLRRRSRFLYAQKHARKLGVGSHPGHSAPPIRMSAQANQIPRSHATLTIRAPKTPTPEFGHDGPAQSTTTATAVDSPLEFNQKQEAKPPTTVISITSSQIRYPRPPSISDAQRVFTCPCCCQSIPATMGRGNQWKKHLMADLLPYTCILHDCPRPEAFYMTREAWSSHMETEHSSTSQWVCHSCTQKNIHTVFREPSAFKIHLEEQHGKGIKPHRIPMLLSAWRRKVPLEISRCPLCGFASDDHDLVLDHTAAHVHSFSLRSLPWGASDILEDEDEDDDDDNYFNKYPYFNIEDSGSDSSNALEGGSSDADSQGLPDLEFEQPHGVPLDGKAQLTETSVEQVADDVRGPDIAKNWLATLDIDTTAADQTNTRDEAPKTSPEITPSSVPEVSFVIPQYLEPTQAHAERNMFGFEDRIPSMLLPESWGRRSLGANDLDPKHELHLNYSETEADGLGLSILKSQTRFRGWSTKDFRAAGGYVPVRKVGGRGHGNTTSKMNDYD
ncbi:hypothetical protein BJX76DRAFT_362718 [Aspergillus varians]